MKFSLVIPVFNEKGNISRLVAECQDVIPPEFLGEIIVVDDCSTDNSADEILPLKNQYKNLRIIRHKTNAGQSAALRSGILEAKFEVIAQLDGDGQNDPADLVKLLARLGQPGTDGPALIGGVRTNRKDTGSKRMASRLANKIRDWALNDHCPDTGCGTKVYWRDAFLKLPFFTSIHRYLPAMFQTYGFLCDYVDVNDRPRGHGKSKYNNLNRAIVGLYDLLGVRWLRARTKSPDIEEL
ncbi:MAG: glycosyltransferase family 2 protein [Pseudomonadota bacterium]